MYVLFIVDLFLDILILYCGDEKYIYLEEWNFVMFVEYMSMF